MNKDLVPIFICALILSACSPAPFILDVYPVNGAVVSDSIITIRFRVAEPIDLRSFSSSSLYIDGSRSGPLNLRARYNQESQEVQFTITDSLHRDEIITVVITDDVRLADGKKIPKGAEWKFWASLRPEQLPKSDTDPNTVYIEVDELPEPIGGIAAIHRNVVYPEEAKRAKIQGTVYVMTYVDETGTVTKTEIVRGIGGGCDEAAAVAIQKTRFIPGKHKKQIVRVKMSIPIRFRLVN